MKRNSNPEIVLLIITCIVLIWSAIKPHDYFTWMLEVFPVIIGAAILIPIYKKFRMTRLAYILIAIHCIILIVGGHYTYAEVPLFNWIRDVFDMQRNNYDKLGHLAQGFIPAIIAREVLLRKSPLKQGRWLFAIVICICLAISTFYELIEWWVAVLTGTGAEAFLGTQGYVWDTQSDMAWALSGAIISLLTLSGIHNKQLREVNYDSV